MVAMSCSCTGRFAAIKPANRASLLGCHVELHAPPVLCTTTLVINADGAASRVACSLDAQ